MADEKIDRKEVEADDRKTVYTSYYKKSNDSVYVVRHRILSNGNLKPDGMFSAGEIDALGNNIKLDVSIPKPKKSKTTIDKNLTPANKQLQKQINTNKTQLDKITELLEVLVKKD